MPMARSKSSESEYSRTMKPEPPQLRPDAPSMTTPKTPRSVAAIAAKTALEVRMFPSSPRRLPALALNVWSSGPGVCGSHSRNRPHGSARAIERQPIAPAESRLRSTITAPFGPRGSDSARNDRFRHLSQAPPRHGDTATPRHLGTSAPRHLTRSLVDLFEYPDRVARAILEGHAARERYRPAGVASRDELIDARREGCPGGLAQWKW